MQPEAQHLALIRRIATKEVTLFFASPVAYLFLAAFVAVSLFIFFWGEAFFARNIADVRPLFEWMPLLLIFLASTLTMRLWSEERRTGTLEHVLTQPVPLWHFVLGKFLGCLVLLTIALLITLPLPLTVSLIADLDWGPVVAGYLAAFLLGAAYLSIGLFVSARSDNQIVSLISAVALCGLLYLIGTPLITDFVGQRAGEWLRLLGTGSRFDAITRGVIDLRDLYYYLSIIAVFLVLNTYVLERERWADSGGRPHHRQWRLITALLAANALLANLWIGQLTALRVDATEGNQYSLSDATHTYLERLREPLLLRGYFSQKTHPLLAPLVPQLKDLMREYAVAGGERVRVEFIDPVQNPELEEEANRQYGIEPTPFQVADRYQSSIVSSYFNVLVQYGDEYEVLGFQDLIEIQARSESDIDVQLRNPEHDLTRAVRKVLHGYQAGGNLFNTVQGTLTFTAYITGEHSLPAPLVEFRQSVEAVLEEIKADAGDQLQIRFVDPEAEGVAERIAEEYGFQPMATSLFSDERFYFYMTLSRGEQHVQIPLGDMSESDFRRNLEAGIKRFASGFTKTVALVVPRPAQPAYAQHGMSGQQFRQLEEFIGAELNTVREDLSDGRVSGEADLLFLAAPEALNEKALFAVDQFLMQGGTVVAATAPFAADLSAQRLNVSRHDSGLDDCLPHHGLRIGEQLVLDPQNAALPVPVNRNVGGFQVQELRMLDYPYFIDVRGEGLNREHPVTADLPQVTLPWASPITVDSGEKRKVTELLRSSEGAWLSGSTNVMPRIGPNGVSGFTPEGETGSHLLGVISSGRFASYFANKPSPLWADKQEEDEKGQADAHQTDEAAAVTDEEQETPVFSGVIEHSPESARIVLFSSNDFLSDQAVQMASTAARSEYLNALQLAANTVDWALEDAGLLSIRGRGHFNRTLPPLSRGNQLFIEYLNYALAVLALLIIALIQRQRQRTRQRQYKELIAQ